MFPCVHVRTRPLNQDAEMDVFSGHGKALSKRSNSARERGGGTRRSGRAPRKAARHVAASRRRRSTNPDFVARRRLSRTAGGRRPSVRDTK
ncbi:hypothetical protein C7S16_5531 [Burkholderia thailandensis]|uniref:Uncharacterized protein n=1 Tax=Burkholderia thailandensis TaxID=57975 RepID=A0AAW9CS23_BURTH|nr:hypothetical protein [Burkholderia thailandensis]MDW9253162.1 hypothetical protein [Burkholderia thailandensis]